MLSEEMLRNLIANANLDLVNAKQRLRRGQVPGNELECASNALDALSSTTLFTKDQANAVRHMHVRLAALRIEASELASEILG